MIENYLTVDETKALARFQQDTPPLDIDPLIYAKLLSLALVEQKEGGPQLTASGLERLGDQDGRLRTVR
jgi:hypothetical protein